MPWSWALIGEPRGLPVGLPGRPCVRGWRAAEVDELAFRLYCLGRGRAMGDRPQDLGATSSLGVGSLYLRG